mgnify:FL=1
MSNLVIDSHSHVGKDIFHGESTIEEYIDFAKKSHINVGIIMGVPSPCIDLKDPSTRFMYWKFNGINMEFYGKKNPFSEMNYKLNELLKEKSSVALQLLFVPTFHPILDEIEQFEKMLVITDPVAIKIHGIGSGVGPNDISQDYIELIKKYELPVIVHVDCDFGKGSQSMQYVRNINRAILWAKFFERNKIKGILNHGASLDLDTFQLVNNSDYLRIALGPDKIACIDNNRLFFDCQSDYKEYLRFLKKHLDTSKILYDADYNWNRMEGQEDDYESVERVKEIFGTGSDAADILSNNLLDFNPKILKKIRRK